MKRLVLAVAVASVSLSGLAGCGKIKEKIAEKAAEKAIETASGGDVKVSSGGVTIKDDQSGSTLHAGTGAKVPDDWPSSVPVYPGATVQAAMTTDKGKAVILQSKDPATKIADFYKGKLSGMKKMAEMDLGKAKTISFQDDKLTVSVMVTESSDPDQPNMIQLSTSPKK